ncbi:uncharacterized protein BDZ99DRAFT_460549 [Mytilinidion resinicola]|uniref:26S proteasome complex subunit SEM1 n=1 Tax=Mytilinidion resinicola TaxID=574789 RepID=A0A6A6YXX6_9PEZI|nr:uncharacterized protein BDZ99DRAFT_460549 [Mytilinidion resinicola]KAF2813283.1 hypothetical protein BDZ99DRAFT_460549 [Mytilinidion resinicola]
MAASGPGAASTTKAGASDAKDGDTKDVQKPIAALEEDDEFEDFPVQDWTEEDTQLPGGNTHLWEESWDDDDTNDEFSVQLKEELKRVGKK